MATYTLYKNLERPTSMEKYNVGVFNRNNDVIDTELHNLDLKNESQDALLATKESLNRHTDDRENPHSVSKAQIGLGNADNTADLDKPVSTAQRAAINDVYIQATAYMDTRIADLPDNAQKTLDTLEEIEANTNEGQIAGALAVKELNNNLGGCQLTQEGNDFFIIGADSVRKKLDSHEIVLLGTVTSTTTFDLSDYTGYETFELDKNILGYVSGSYDQSTGILTVNQNTVSGYVTVSGYGYVMDVAGNLSIKRVGNGQMGGTASMAYPKTVYLVY